LLTQQHIQKRQKTFGLAFVLFPNRESDFSGGRENQEPMKAEEPQILQINTDTQANLAIPKQRTSDSD